MYPTMEQVESAAQMQLCEWYRFLKSPGSDAIGSSIFQQVMDREKPIMDRIVKRVKEEGGFTPAISKALGW